MSTNQSGNEKIFYTLTDEDCAALFNVPIPVEERDLTEANFANLINNGFMTPAMEQFWKDQRGWTYRSGPSLADQEQEPKKKRQGTIADLRKLDMKDLDQKLKENIHFG